MTIELKGRIDSNNAAKVEMGIKDQLAGKNGEPVILDSSELAYISSAGLRVILRLKKAHPDLTPGSEDHQRQFRSIRDPGHDGLY